MGEDAKNYVHAFDFQRNEYIFFLKKNEDVTFRNQILLLRRFYTNKVMSRETHKKLPGVHVIVLKFYTTYIAWKFLFNLSEIYCLS
jgi:hypothetical protein